MKIHFVGVSGVSMRALSRAAASRGHTVTGSDNTLCGHDPRNVEGCDLVVYTNAVPPSNPELVRAKELGIPVIERAAYLGELSKTYNTVVAVAGCHGKSTVTSMIGAAFTGRNATVHVGVKDGSHIGGDKYFITEACEYRASFLHLRPDIGVVLNVQYDHPDFYRNEKELVGAYERFCGNCSAVLVNGDDETARGLCDSPVTFGLGANNDYTAENITDNNGFRAFTFNDKRRGKHARVELSVAGEHNVYNALAAIAASCECGLTLTEILPRLRRFTGIARRFERKGIAFGKTVFTDYAHHPTEIASAIKTAKEIFPSVAVVFQPHTYSRTQSLMDDFAGSLALADTVVLAPVFSARENPIDGVSSHALCRKIVQQKDRAYCFDTFAEIVEYCAALKEKAVIFMGAGDIDKAADMMIRNSECGITE